MISSKILSTVFNKTFREVEYIPETRAAAPSSLALYNADAIPGCKNSLLIPSLKEGILIRMNIDEDLKVSKEEKEYFETDMRYRDLAISNDGTRIYLSTDKSKTSSGFSKENPENINCKGVLLSIDILKKIDKMHRLN